MLGELRGKGRMYPSEVKLYNAKSGFKVVFICGSAAGYSIIIEVNVEAIFSCEIVG